jgi:hypothetical protein
VGTDVDRDWLADDTVAVKRLRARLVPAVDKGGAQTRHLGPASLRAVSDPAPPEIHALAEARSAARAAGDWTEADRLRAEIERAGWKVVDAGTSFRLTPAVAPDRVDDGRVRYGASTSVPSRLTEPAAEGATVVTRATDRPGDLVRLLAGLRANVPAGTQTIIVADAPSRAQADALDDPDSTLLGAIAGIEPEVVWLATRLGQAGAVDAGLRRAGNAVVVVIDSRIEPTGDLISPLVHALDDPTVAVVGAWGSLSTDLRRFKAADPGDVAVVDGGVLAFRRDDLTTHGPLDEAFRTGAHLDAWWSLVLRDQGEDEPPRRAVRLADLPVVRHEAPEDDAFPPGERTRLDKRAFYRIVQRFGSRRDLIVGGEAGRGPDRA